MEDAQQHQDPQDQDVCFSDAERVNDHIDQAGREAAPCLAQVDRIREDQLQVLRQKAAVAEEHLAKLMEGDKNYQIKRLRQENKELQELVDDLERQLLQGATTTVDGSDGAAAAPDLGPNDGVDSAGGPSQHLPAPPSWLPVLLVRMPPILPLDPARLLVGCDPGIDFTTPDINQQVHEFTEQLFEMCNQPEPIRAAAALIDAYERAAIPRGAVGALPSNIMEVGRPAILAHVLMCWLQDEVWADPLQFLDSSVRLGTPLPACGGPTPAPERNLVALLESHAARSWLPVVRDSLQAALDTDAGESPAGGLKQSGGHEAAVQKSADTLCSSLANWLHNTPGFAEMVNTQAPFRRLLLRALHLGLFVKAAHPLLRLRVATPAFRIGPEGSPIPVDLTRQESQRRVRFTAACHEAICRTEAGPFVFYSTRPGVMYDAAAATAAGALGTVCGSSEAMCLIKEEVVSWVWDGSEQG
ncbi:hypothetical protein GPECTOR_7g1186 [Gonium pectorale]|uniref:Uncharacterized protein n=1 Tax=Gonium pectorale TaxID=33097 RepID=A0A150GU80_GONPE|nr:hypothetical protein GPECTOR_7g1186 [Gonium pectorale]|eukprot:KXZ53292.1 hypothetical protein GPECTOR_7g1186 [Gonium pectorale]